jgi:hypothetical protein
MQFTNIESGYIGTFIIGIPLSAWGYFMYLHHKKKGVTSSRTKGLSGEATTKQLSGLGSIMGDEYLK